MFGTNPDRPAIPYDPDRARELLADAGYADGFSIVLGTPNDRYINDGPIAQAVAQMWTQIGVRTEVDAKTFSAFIADRNAFNFSAFLAGWGAGTGEMSSPLGALVATRDPDRSLGGTNFARHSNTEIDDRLVEALQTVDDAERERLLREGSAHRDGHLCHRADPLRADHLGAGAGAGVRGAGRPVHAGLRSGAVELTRILNHGMRRA
jgi:peptide/nickel transport system substrate-binding protein